MDVIAAGTTSLSSILPTEIGTRPSAGDFATILSTKASSHWIKGDGINHLAYGLNAAQVIDHFHKFANTIWTIAQERKPHEMPQCGGISNRCDIALIVHTCGSVALIKQMRPSGQLFDCTNRF